MEPVEKIRAVARLMVMALVDLEDEVRVEATTAIYGGVGLLIRVSPADQGKIVGKGGHMARLLRSYLDAVARKHGLRCELNIMQPGKGVACE